MVASGEQVRQRMLLIAAQKKKREEAAAQGPEEEEEESEDEAVSKGATTAASKEKAEVPKIDPETGAVQFVWDASKGGLVEKVVEEATKAQKNPSKAAVKEEHHSATEAANPAADASEKTGKNDEDVEEKQEPSSDDEEEGESSEEEDEEDDEDEAEAASKMAFLNEASTPELIKQAISIGGTIADGVRDKWILDKVTQLQFRYVSESRTTYCWNGDQGCMYIWRERGKMTFLWSAPEGPSKTPPTDNPAVPPLPSGAKAAEGAAGQGQGGGAHQNDFQKIRLQVTIMPPEVLIPGGITTNTTVVEEVEMSAKAMAGVIGKGGASIAEIEKLSGAKASQLEAREGEHMQRIQLTGTKAQVQDAKQMLEQKVVLTIGEKAAEKMQKHINSKILERKRHETGADAAKQGVAGLSDFCKKWGVKAINARKIAKLDAMLQRYMIRHFNPTKAKAANAIKGYSAALMKHPQKWRLEALYEDGELDGEVCETILIGMNGAMVGRQSAEADMTSEEQLIELEVDSSMGERASRVYGDVQPQHCKLLQMGKDYYVWSQESQIGTIVDGQKIREQDGPYPIRDGSVLGVGKYLLYCEIGTPDVLQARRRKLLSGERPWASTAAEAPAAQGEEATEAAAATTTTTTEETASATTATAAPSRTAWRPRPMRVASSPSRRSMARSPRLFCSFALGSSKAAGPTSCWQRPLQTSALFSSGSTARSSSARCSSTTSSSPSCRPSRARATLAVVVVAKAPPAPSRTSAPPAPLTSKTVASPLPRISTST